MVSIDRRWEWLRQRAWLRADARPMTRLHARGAVLAVIAIVQLFSGCGGGPPSIALPTTVTADFFPLEVGNWWEYDTFYPGFPTKPERFRFVMKAAGPDGGYPVVSRPVTPGTQLPDQTFQLRQEDGFLLMVKEDEAIRLLKFGARVGDTWPCFPMKPHYRARLAAIRYEKVMGAWHPIAEVTFHAGSPDTDVTKRYWFAPSLGWVRIVQHRSGGSAMEALLVEAQVRAPTGEGTPRP